MFRNLKTVLIEKASVLIALLLVPLASSANEISVIPLLLRINKYILNPLIVLMFVVAMVYFLWGLLRFVGGMGNEEARDMGKSIWCGVWLDFLS
jgi:hypothetical protein